MVNLVLKDRTIKISGKLYKVLKKKAFYADISIKQLAETMIQKGIDLTKEKV